MTADLTVRLPYSHFLAAVRKWADSNGEDIPLNQAKKIARMIHDRQSGAMSDNDPRVIAASLPSHRHDETLRKAIATLDRERAVRDSRRHASARVAARNWKDPNNEC